MRGSTSVARINFLHSRYGSKIKQSDMLFTLALFIFEPIDLIGAFEWRELTVLEQTSRYVFWRELGARMGIENIPRTMAAFREWKSAYAKEAMVYSEENEKTGAATLDILLRPFPNMLKPFGKQAAMTLIDDHTREAFGWPPASPGLLYWLVPALLRLRGAFIRYFMFPRKGLPAFLTMHEKDGKIVREGFLFEPWYTPAGYSSIGALGIGEPGGAKWQSDGWTPETLGPDRLKAHGASKTLLEAQSMRNQANICPFFK